MCYRRFRPILIAVLGMGCLLPALAGPGPETPAETGPLIEEFGPTYAVEEPDFLIPKRQSWRLVFDVSRSPEDPAERNPRLETAARFLNMHARAGVPAERMKLVLVVHGEAGKDLLQDAAYRARVGTYNPNDALLRELMKNGVRIVLCGQTAAHRGLNRDELEPGIEIALSAMTALTVLQGQGYALIAF